MIQITYEDIGNPLYNKRGANNYILYLHNSPSDKYYVGITCQGIKRRWRYDGSGYYQCKYFYNAIQKYGFDNFKHFIIRMNLDEITANKCEVNMIKNLKSAGFQLYNVSDGGRAVFKGLSLSKEHKRKISESNMGRTPTVMSITGKERLVKGLIGNKNALGHRHTENTRKQISESLLGRKRNPFSVEHRKCISERKKGKKLSECQKQQLERLHKSNIGRKMPQSAIDLLIKRNKGRIYTENTIKKMSKAIIQYDLNMNKINEFISGQEAFRKTGTDNSSITKCCKGKLKTANGYIWRYKEDIKNDE